MSDTETPRDDDMLEQPVTADEPITEDAGLLIIPGGIAADDVEGDEPAFDIVTSEPDLEPESAPVNELDPAATEAASAPMQSEFTLDELVAEMAGVSAVSSGAGTSDEVVPVVAERADPLAAAMSDAFAEAPPVESELWTRLPFWVIGVAWAAFVGVLTYLLWPVARQGLDGAPLYGVMVFGGAGMVVLGLVVGLIVWSQARTRAAQVDRAGVSRTVLLRTLGWTSAGVALWVVCMIVLSLHSLDVIR